VFLAATESEKQLAMPNIRGTRFKDIDTWENWEFPKQVFNAGEAQQSVPKRPTVDLS